MRTTICAAVRRELEIEARAERLVAEAELHHLRLDDDAPALEERQEIARVFAANVDADPPRALVLEASEQADRVAIGRRVLVLRDAGGRSAREGTRFSGLSSVIVRPPPRGAPACPTCFT